MQAWFLTELAMRFFSHISLALAALALAGCATTQNPVTGQREVSSMSESQEVAMGREADQQVRSEYGVYNNPALQAYVNDIGQRMAKLSHRANLEWHFTVVDSPEINAFALPGGYVYVTRGIMAYLESEAELAGVIGHEIGHVTARHGAQRQTRQQVASVGVVAAQVLGEVLGRKYGIGNAGDIAGRVAGTVAQGVVMSYGREQELQADELGAEYLSRIGQDPRSMVRVIGVLKAQQQFAEDNAARDGKAGQRMPTWLSSHPSNDLRLQQIREIAARYQATYGDPGRERYLQKINGTSFGDSRDQGVVRGDSFYHEPLGLALRAPLGWKLQNSPEALLIVNPEGTAGVSMELATGQGNTHDEIIRKAIRPLQGRPETTQINGFAATRFSGTRQVEGQGAQAPVEAVVMTVGKETYLFSLLAKSSAAFTSARGSVQSVAQTVRTMTDADKRNARTYQVRTLPAQRGLTPQQLAARSQSGAATEPQMRLLNGIYPSGNLPETGWIKTIE
jgi:predicted Zn-dependent protease